MNTTSRSMPAGPHVVIVGGGISGLAAAVYLLRSLTPVRVTILEATDRPGGTIRTERVDGFVIEHGPDVALTSRLAASQLAIRLDLADRIIHPQAVGAFVATPHGLSRLPAGIHGIVPADMEAVRASGLLSATGMARLANEHAQPPRLDTDDESIASFACRRIGREAYERITEPLLTGIYGGDGSKLSVISTFPSLREMERQYGSLTAAMQAQQSATAPPDTPPFLSFPLGMEELTRAAYSRVVETRGATFVSGARVSGISARCPTTGQGQVRWNDDSAVAFDALILALPARTTATLLHDIAPKVAREIGTIPHESMAIVTLAYRDTDIPVHMTGTGYVRPRVLDDDVAACTWTSSKFAGRSPPGMRLLRVFMGGAHRRALPHGDDETLLAVARRELEQCMGITAAPALIRVTRHIDSMPQYHVGHKERMARIEQGLAVSEWLSVAGNAYYGVGIPDCIATGARAAERALAMLGTRAESTRCP